MATFYKTEVPDYDNTGIQLAQQAQLQQADILQKGLAGIGNTLVDTAHKKAEKDRLAQARTDKLTQQELENKRVADKLAQDEAIGDLLTKTAMNRTKQQSISVPGNQAEIDAITASNAKIDARVADYKQKQADRADELYLDAVDDEFEAQLAGVKEVDTTRGSGRSKIAGKVETVIPDALQQAHKRVQQLEGKTAKIDQSVIDSVLKAKQDIPELVKPSTKTKNVPVTRQEWTQSTYNQIMGDEKLTGSSKLAAIKQLNSQADALFGKAEQTATFDQLFKAQKYQKGQQGDEMVAKTLAKDYGVTVPSGLSGSAALEFVKNSKAYKRANKSLTGSKISGPGAETLKAYESGLGTIDEDDQRKLETAGKEYGLTDKELAGLITQINNKGYFPRSSGAVTDEVLQFIERTRTKK